MAQRSITLGSLAPGVNNRLEPTELDTKLADGKPAHFLASGANITLNDKGYIKRREGFTSVLAGAIHSLWSDPQGGFMVRDGDLVTINPSTVTVDATVRAGVGGSTVSYARGADNDVYWTNGSLLRRWDGQDDLPVITPPPVLVPSLSVGAGALPAGTYLLAFTMSSEGGESPATPVQAVTVPDNSSITVSTTENVNIYMTAPDGDILTYQGTGTGYPVVTFVETARRCMTLNRATMPAGQIVRFHRGSMLVASGGILYVSDPYNYGVYNPSKGWFPFSATIDMIEVLDNGIYISADQTYWISDLFEDKLQAVLPYGAIPGSSVKSPDTKEVYWMTSRGLVLANDNMAVKNLQEDNLEFGDASFGASVYRERDGASHVITSRAGVQPESAAALSWMDAEIVRKGTVL